MMVTHDPGDWFSETLEAVAALEYPALDVVVVDTASDVPVADRVAAVLPDARVVRLDDNPGFGRAVDAARARVGTGPLLLLAHDDVLPAADAVRAMVEEAFRSNAAVVGPKLVRWDDPRRLLAVGEGADKFGFPVAYVERGELDQEQLDAVRDVFCVPDAFTLVRTDLLEAIGGFDVETSWFGDDLDLCWRAHVAGGRVMVAPGARVRHLEALGERRPVDDRRRHQFRHRLRIMLGAYRGFNLLRIVPQLLIVHAVEAIFALLTGRPAQARDVVGAWAWNLRRLSSLRRRRAALQQVRRVPDAEVRSLQVRGSARIAAFFRGQLAVGEDPLGSAATMSRRMIDAVAGPGRRGALMAWLTVGLVMLLGSRHLLTRGVPALGDFVLFPEQVGPVIGEWASDWRRAAIGGRGFAASTDLVAGAVVALSLGAAGLARTVLIVGMLPLGLYGVWRLVAPAHSVRASVVGLFAYVSIPIGFDSLATGSWRGLIGYGLTPWVLARILRASGDAPFGAPDPPAGPRMEVPPLWRQTLALGVLVALAAAFDPLWVALPLAVVVAMVPGSLVSGRLRGLLRMGAVSVGAGVVALVLHLPWALDLLGPDTDWSSFTAGRGPAATPTSIPELLRFDTGPIGSSLLNAAVVVAATYVLLVGRGWRLTWAARAWSIALVAWGVSWAWGMGWIPVGLPPSGLVLAPAGAALALAVGLGAAAFDFDVRRRRFSWRQVASIVAVGAVGVGFLPVLAASIGGRWLVPRSDHHQALSFLDTEAEEHDMRVLWLGAPELLPLGSWPLVDGASYATTQNGLPEVQDLHPGNPEPADAPLRHALDLAIDLDTTRLGRLLAPMGVRYLVVVEQLAPAPYGGPSRDAPEALTAALEQQLDLERIDVNPSIALYRNDAWSPIVASVPTETLEDASVGSVAEGMREAAGLRLDEVADAIEMTGVAEAEGVVGPARQVLIGSAPSAGWRVTVDGDRAPVRSVLGWAAAADTGDGGEVSVDREVPLEHRLVLAGQVAAILLVVVVMYVTRAEARDLRRRRGRRVARRSHSGGRRSRRGTSPARSRRATATEEPPRSSRSRTRRRGRRSRR